MNLKKMEWYLRVNLLGPGPRLIKKRIYRAAVSQRLRNNALEDPKYLWEGTATNIYGNLISNFLLFVF